MPLPLSCRTSSQTNRKGNIKKASKPVLRQRDLPSWSEEMKQPNKIFLYNHHLFNVWDMVIERTITMQTLRVWADAVKSGGSTEFWKQFLYTPPLRRVHRVSWCFPSLCLCCMAVAHSESCFSSVIVLHTGISSILAPTAVVDLITQGLQLSDPKSSFLSIPTSNTSTDSKSVTFLPSHSPHNCQSKPS